MNSDHIYSFIFWNWSLLLLWVCIEAYDGCTIPSPNLEIESKYFMKTMILVYSAVLSAYVYTYVALHICRCLKCSDQSQEQGDGQVYFSRLLILIELPWKFCSSTLLHCPPFCAYVFSLVKSFNLLTLLQSFFSARLDFPDHVGVKNRKSAVLRGCIAPHCNRATKLYY